MKLLMLKKEKYGDKYELFEMDSIESIVKEVEGNLSDIIIAKLLKITYNVVEEIEEGE